MTILVHNVQYSLIQRVALESANATPNRDSAITRCIETIRLFAHGEGGEGGEGVINKLKRIKMKAP